MRALGYNVWLHKYLAFVIAGAFAGFAGVLWAYYNGFVSPADVQLVTSVETLLMVALGGPGTLVGPALGAALIVFLKNFVSVYTKRWLLILGAVYIGVILFAPAGCRSALSRKEIRMTPPDRSRADPGPARRPGRAALGAATDHRPGDAHQDRLPGSDVPAALRAGRQGHAQRAPSSTWTRSGARWAGARSS